MSTKTVKLKHPVKGPDGTLNELKFRRAKGSDMRKLSGKPDVGEIMDLAASLADVPPFVIDDLDIDDWQEVMEVVGNFMERGLQTGRRSSKT